MSQPFYSDHSRRCGWTRRGQENVGLPTLLATRPICNRIPSNKVSKLMLEFKVPNCHQIGKRPPNPYLPALLTWRHSLLLQGVKRWVNLAGLVRRWMTICIGRSDLRVAVRAD